MNTGQPTPHASAQATPPLRAATAVVIAGGHGRRAGGPKALKIRDGELMWRWQARHLQALGCAPVACVLHPAALPEISPNSSDQTPLIVVPADPDAEMLASLQAGLAALPPDQPVFVLPVDCPCPPSAVFHALAARSNAAAAAEQDWQVIRPFIHTPDGPRRGHPVLLSPGFVREIAAADPESDRLDHLIAKLHETQRPDVEVTSDAIVANHNYGGLAR
ncbi:MAG: NTP transferase domain-containing protein [Myxococcales bacterium]|nr:NTP transferase domain-containing protein [Myxococcales bacterium]